MTIAICYKCGESKFGAFTSCQKCGARPSSEDDLALSLAMTDHYFDRPSLEAMGADIKLGKPLQLDAETRENIVHDIRASSGFFKGNMPKTLKPWWKFW